MTWRIVQGDALERLREMPEGSVHCCVTSPPYFGLRDYGVDGQLGLESTLAEYIDRLVEVFAEVRRVLRPDGTVWLNIGDSYASKPRGSDNGWDKSRLTNPARVQKAQAASLRRGRRTRGEGAKNKDLLMVPAVLALALRDDGWWLRSDIIWAKPSCMPESVTDRPTRSHEHLFLLAKSERYFYDTDAIREADRGQDYPRSALDGQASLEPSNGLAAPHRGLRTPIGRDGLGRNKRDVWTVASTPFPGAHFATFPPKLIEPCILAGTSEHGACEECGAPWRRIVERTAMVVEPAPKRAAAQEGDDAVHHRTAVGGTMVEPPTSRTIGWEPTCEHDFSGGTAGSVVLDPFSGAGTTGMVALRHGRSYIGIELNPEYVEMSRRRIHDDAPLLNTASEAVA